jgi:hypothetical protein
MKLVSGAGSEKTGACWMSALNWYVNVGKKDFRWTDKTECVDPVIRSLCIWLNDKCEDGEREALIGPHLFQPVGTWQGAELSLRRAYKVAYLAVRVFAPCALDAAKLPK